jgi:hypothetical protein
MNKRYRRTLGAIFASPTPATLSWRDVEALLRSLGAHVEERAGSRVAVELRGAVRVFHRPHPRPEMKKASVRDVRDFLQQVGVKP